MTVAVVFFLRFFPSLCLAAASKPPFFFRQSTSSALDSSQDESRQLKCLIAALHVKREDFAALHAASTTRASALQTVGCRILSALVSEGARDGPTISAHRGEAPEGDRRSSRISQQSRSAASPTLCVWKGGGFERFRETRACMPLCLIFRAPLCPILRAPLCLTWLNLARASVPRSVLDEYPEEAQIAAAALVAYNSDPVAALTALMEVALAARQHPAIQG